MIKPLQNHRSSITQPPAGLLFALLFGLFAAAIVGDSAAETLLLAEYGAGMIRWMFLINALFLFVSSVFLLPVIDRINRGRFFISFVLLHAIIVLAVWAAVAGGLRFLFIPLFCYAYVSKIFLFLLFWTIANDLIDARSAGSRFPVIAAGGTLGAIAVSFTIPFLVRFITPSSLLLAWSVLSLGVALVFVPLWRAAGGRLAASGGREPGQSRGVKGVTGDLRFARREPLLWNMAVLYFLLFFVLLNQQYGFYEALKARLGQARDIASFLGFFNGISMGVTLLLQLTVSGALIRRIGSTRAMFLLPAVFGLVFATLALAGLAGFGPAELSALLFWAIIAGVGLRIAVFDSFFSPNFQLFFSSLPREVRGRGKVAIEGVVKPLAITAASLWLLLAAPRLSFGLNMALLFALAVAAIVQTFRLRRKYTESILRHLAGYQSRGKFDAVNLPAISRQENLLAALMELLEREAFEIKHYIAEILADIRTPEALELLTAFARRTDARNRAMIIAILSRRPEPVLRPFLLAALEDADGRVVANAIFALSLGSDRSVAGRLQPFLHHPHQRVRANAIVALWQCGDPALRPTLHQVLHGMLGSDQYWYCASGLFALGEIRDGGVFTAEIEPFLERNRELLRTNRSVWRQFLSALAQNPCELSLTLLLVLAENANRRRINDLCATLVQLLQHAPAREWLLGRLRGENFMRRSLLLRALCQSRPVLDRQQQRTVMEVAESEMREVYTDWLAFFTLGQGVLSREAQLLLNAIHEECIQERLQSLIHCAALLDSGGRIREIMGRLRHENRHVRACALEVLDNAGNSRLNRWIVKLLDEQDPAGHGREARETLRIGTPLLVDVITRFEASPNEWVRLCALCVKQGLRPLTRS